MQLIDFDVHVPTADEIERQRFNDVLDMQAEFYSVMISRGEKVTEADTRYAMKTLWAWTRPEQMQNPVVIAAECGFGKSTLIEIFVRYMVRKYPDSFGCVVVKPKREQLKDFVDAVNSDGVRRHRYAYAVYGYDPSKTTHENYRRQFSAQAYFPVVAMTSEMFARQSTLRNLERFMTFYNADERKQRRTLLLIDERPVITRNFQFTLVDLNRLLSEVREVSHIVHDKDAEYYADIKGYVDQLRDMMEDYRDEERHKERIPAIDRYFLIPDRLRRDWMNHYDGDHFDALGSFENAVKFGGLITMNDGEAKLTVSHKISYEWTAFNPFIMDATALTDPQYYAYDFKVFEQEKSSDYSHMTFHINDQYNLSRSFFRSNHSAIQAVAEMVRGIAETNTKTMLVTFKENLPDLREYLAQEITNGKIKTKHLDSGRATNDFRDCDAAVFIGWLLKGDAYYPQLASAIYDEALPFDSTTDKTKGLRYHDEKVDETRAGDLVTERIQDIHRVRPRSSDAPISVYIFHRDHELTNRVIKQFPGAKRREYIPAVKLSGEKTTADKFIEYIEKMSPGDRVKRSYLYNTALQTHRKNLSKIEKNPRVIQALEKNSVERSGQFYIKR